MKNFFYIDNAILLSVVIVIFYIAVLIYSDISKIFNQILKFNLIFLPIILSFVGIQLLILGLKYHRMLQKIEIFISLSESIKIYIAGLSLIATPGGIGTTIKSQILKKKYNVSHSKSLPTIFMERLTELIANLIIISVFFYWTNLFESVYAISFGFIFVFVMFLLISKNKTFDSLKNFLNKINKFKKFSNSIDDSKESFQILIKKPILLEMIGWSLIAKIVQLFAVYFIFLSLNLDLGILLSGQIYFTSLILGALSFLPSGIIITESTMIAMLNHNGVQISLAASLVIFIRLLTTWLATFIGIIILKIIQTSK